MTYLILFLAIIAILSVINFRYFVTSDPGGVNIEKKDGDLLMVLVPPLDGQAKIPDLKALIRNTYPHADLMIPTSSNGWFANTDPLDLADVLEEYIRLAHDTNQYSRIILFGYSLGGVIARKAFVWGHGREEDRVGGGRRPLGKHGWVDKVERFISLAAPNRGWRSDEMPEHVPFYLAWIATTLEKIGRITGTGRLLRGVLAGSPFIANMRLQWIELCRTNRNIMPLVIHLVGKRDELVSRDDNLDLSATPGVMFKTIPATTHSEIRNIFRVGNQGNRELNEIGLAIEQALTLENHQFPAGWSDLTDRTEDPSVHHIIYIMHGIRDEGDWTDVIEDRIFQSLGEAKKTVVIPAVRYNRFAMLPFLLYWDRQRNVRRFMDQYTEDLARYPNATAIDYFGHSNGTYILASALQQYKTLKVRNVLFAGSVVPSHFNWVRYANERRIEKVRNIVADTDWVVALFPQLFETISQSLLHEEEPSPGLFDIGAAGFRGFLKANQGGVVEDIRFVSGSHGAAIDVVGVGLAERKRDAITAFLVRGDDSQLSTFRMTSARSNILHILSNLSWLVWLIIFAAVAALAWLTFYLGWGMFFIYCLVLIIILSTV